MKKIIYFTLITLFIMTGSCFAWTVTSSGLSATDPSIHRSSINDAKASKNVTIQVTSGAQSYAAEAGHASGNKTYGVASGSSLVFYKDQPTGSAVPTTAPTNSDSREFTSGWSAL